MRNEQKIRQVLDDTLKRHNVRQAFKLLEPKDFTFEEFESLLISTCKVAKGIVSFKKAYNGPSEITKVFLVLWHDKIKEDGLRKQLGSFYNSFDFSRHTSCFYSAFDFQLYLKALSLVSLLRSCFGMESN
jgi:hypothetical protein